MIELLLATHSAGKIREIREITRELHWHWRGLDEFPEVTEAVEDADTFLGNATRKALHYSRATGLPALADDSGLEVDALGGEPGVHSAYYAGKPRDDAANNRKLITALSAISPEARTARFRCVMVFAANDEVLHHTSGAIEGLIVESPRGANGFGYDPHFLVQSLKRTTAELLPAEKNSISHRGNALRAMIPFIAEWTRRQS